MKVVEIDGRKVLQGGTVNFTRKQYEYLEKIYGENPCGPNATDAQLRWNSGVRTVIQHIKGLVNEG